MLLRSNWFDFVALAHRSQFLLHHTRISFASMIHSMTQTNPELLLRPKRGRSDGFGASDRTARIKLFHFEQAAALSSVIESWSTPEKAGSGERKKWVKTVRCHRVPRKIVFLFDSGGRRSYNYVNLLHAGLTCRHTQHTHREAYEMK